MSYFTCQQVLGFGLPGGSEWLIVLVIALLLFGKRLPEVARNMGKGIVEFKKGVKGIEEEVEDASSEPEGHGSGASSSSPHVYDDQPASQDTSDHPPKV